MDHALGTMDEAGLHHAHDLARQTRFFDLPGEQGVRAAWQGPGFVSGWQQDTLRPVCDSSILANNRELPSHVENYRSHATIS